MEFEKRGKMRTRKMSKTGIWVLSIAAATVMAGTAGAAEINIYSARHYQTDEKLYTDFTKQTGIKINRIEGKEAELIEHARPDNTLPEGEMILV